MKEKMRVTMHNGRAGKKGVYSAKHNDRNFDLGKAEHIDADKVSMDWHWHRMQKTAPDMTFDQVEQKYYEDHFTAALVDRNERAIKARHPERVIDMETYRKSRKTCPEETIMQIGRKGSTVEPDVLRDLVVKQLNWEAKKYPQCKVLDVSLHVDEQGAPHLHRRQVWVAHDKDGREIVGQAKALEEMGIQAPHPDKPIGTHNNAKQTYTRDCREHFIELCREYNLDIEVDPKEKSQSGLDLAEYKTRQEQEKADLAWVQADQAQQLQVQLQLDIRDLNAQIERKEAEKAKTDKSIAETQKALIEASERLQEVQDKQKELANVSRQIETAQKELADILALKERAARIKEPSKLGKLIFQQDDVVVYDRKTAEDLQGIGLSVRTKLYEIGKKQQDLDRRESEVSRKEREIKPLYAKAKTAHDNAQDLLEQQEHYILSTGHEVGQELFDKFIEQEFGQETKGRSARMEEFLGKFTMDDKSLLEMFDEQERELQHKLSRSWDDFER